MRPKTKYKLLKTLGTMKKFVKKIDDALYKVSALGFMAILAAVVAVIHLVCAMVTPVVNYLVWGIELP